MMEGTDRAMRVALSAKMKSSISALPFLASVASVSPYIGLFGTVWGIMNSFRGLAMVQQATLATVAPESLKPDRHGHGAVCRDSRSNCLQPLCRHSGDHEQQLRNLRRGVFEYFAPPDSRQLIGSSAVSKWISF